MLWFVFFNYVCHVHTFACYSPNLKFISIFSFLPMSVQISLPASAYSDCLPAFLSPILIRFRHKTGPSEWSKKKEKYNAKTAACSFMDLNSITLLCRNGTETFQSSAPQVAFVLLRLMNVDRLFVHIPSGSVHSSLLHLSPRTKFS